VTLFKHAFILLVISTILSGCAATGAKYQAVEAIPSDKALITFYRPKAFTGSAVSIKLVDNDSTIGSIQNGQFINYFTDAGSHRIHTKTAAIDKPLELDLEAGQHYFIKTILRQGLWVSTWSLSRVFKEEAISELDECCKSGQ